MARRAATVTAPWRAWRAVAVISRHVGVEGAPGLVHRDRGQPLHLRLGGDDLDRRRRARASAVRAAISAARTVSPSLGSTTTSAAPHETIASSSWPVEGRRPGPAGDDDRARGLEEGRQPGPGRDARPPATRAGRGPPPAGGDLVGEVRDPDAVRAPGGDPGLDGGADVVDVHVDVPQAVAAHHDQAVPEAGERLAQTATASTSASARRRAGTSPRSPDRPR